jgi:2,4-dienoyl-CoA reductase-like NADH-dependent reductase (Old Yellow Enzyme family)
MQGNQKRRAMVVEELARLVLDFIKADRAVAENGWDGVMVERHKKILTGHLT